MVPIRIIAKCTVIPHDDFLSGPYVIYFYFMNIHSTSNLDKYMARSSCIWSRTPAPQGCLCTEPRPCWTRITDREGAVVSSQQQLPVHCEGPGH